MRKLFIPLAKLLGIYLLYHPVAYFISMLYYFFSGALSEQNGVWAILLFNLAVQILILFFTLILLFKTERIADIVRLPDDDINLTSIDRYLILHTGLILIGVVIFIYGITVFLASALNCLRYRDIAETLYYQEQQRLLSSILRAILGIILIFKSRPIARFFNEKE